VWLDNDGHVPAEIPIGDMGAIQDDLVMDRDTISGLRAFEIPTMRTLRRVSKYFPGCICDLYHLQPHYLVREKGRQRLV
jgi:hypothetical protein